MSQPGHGFPLVSPSAVGSGAEGGAGTELFVREARRDGETVVRLRCVRRGDEFGVECEIRPQPQAGALVTGPQQRTYAFASRELARSFVDEAAAALEFLGCEIV